MYTQLNLLTVCHSSRPHHARITTVQENITFNSSDENPRQRVSIVIRSDYGTYIIPISIEPNKTEELPNHTSRHRCCHRKEDHEYLIFSLA